MDDLLETFDTLVETLGIDMSETNAEQIKTYRDSITTATSTHSEMLENNIKLLETNEGLNSSLKEQKKKYYEKFMTGGIKTDEEKLPEEIPTKPISELINLI